MKEAGEAEKESERECPRGNIVALESGIIYQLFFAALLASRMQPPSSSSSLRRRVRLSLALLFLSRSLRRRCGARQQCGDRRRWINRLLKSYLPGDSFFLSFSLCRTRGTFPVLIIDNKSATRERAHGIACGITSRYGWRLVSSEMYLFLRGREIVFQKISFSFGETKAEGNK